jgi:glycosyltransferase involved in cell wall biosynthesis
MKIPIPAPVALPGPPPAPASGPAAASLPLTIIILTFNAEASIAHVIAACAGLARRILVVDSYSTDRTLDIVRRAGCDLVQHPFVHYGQQRNWAQDYAAVPPQDYVLHLDADEVLSPALAASIRAAVAAGDRDGYLMQRITYFLGQPIRHGMINPSWHLRLFRAGAGRCEDRQYDQHFICPGPTRRLAGELHDLQLITVERWTTTHNRWSTAEAAEIIRRRALIPSTAPSAPSAPAEDGLLPASLTGDPRMRKRWLKDRLYYRSPLFIRPVAYFLYSYILRQGFRDGMAGLVYHTLHAFWFRFLVDAKIHEQGLAGRPGGYPRLPGLPDLSVPITDLPAPAAAPSPPPTASSAPVPPGTAS